MKVTRLLNIALAVMIVYAVVQLVNVLMMEPRGDLAPELTSAVEEKPAVKIAVEKIKPAGPPTVAPPPEKEVTLDHLTLTGVLVNSKRPENSMAMIKVNRGEEMMVVAGLEIEPGVVLESVEFTHSIVKHKGKKVRLDLKGNLPAKTIQASRTPVSPKPAREALAARPQVAPSGDQPRKSPPLKVAAQNGNIEQMKEYIRRGADVNEKDSVGGYPIMYAAFKGNKEAVNLLIENGADLSVNNFGWTPLKIATVNQNWDLVELLKKAGAKR